MRIAGLFTTMINMQQSPEVREALCYKMCWVSHCRKAVLGRPATSRSTSRGWSRRGWRGWRCSWWSRWPTSSSGAPSSSSPSSTGAGSGRTPRSRCLTRCQKTFKVFRDFQKKKSISHKASTELLKPLPQVSLHVAFVHSFVNPLLFVVLHKGCRCGGYCLNNQLNVSETEDIFTKWATIADVIFIKI